MEIAANKPDKQYIQADQIIRYLMSSNDSSVTLTATEKKKLDHCKMIHGLRQKFMRKTELVAVIRRTCNVEERQAYNLIIETERIFGTVNRVHKDYERQFALEISRKNIELAQRGRNSTQITKALLAHYRIAGLEEFLPDMPDFAALEQHKYIISLPANVLSFLQGLLKSGAIKLTDIVPPPRFDDAEEAEVVE